MQTTLADTGNRPSEVGYSTTGPWVGNGPWDFYRTVADAGEAGCRYVYGVGYVSHQANPPNIYNSWQVSCNRCADAQCTTLSGVGVWEVRRCAPGWVMHWENTTFGPMYLSYCTWNCPGAAAASAYGQCVDEKTPKSEGPPADPAQCQGNPCDVSSGTKLQFDTDYESVTGLRWVRTYRSSAKGATLNYARINALGIGWITSYLVRAEVTNVSAPYPHLGVPSPARVFAARPGGQTYAFRGFANTWNADLDINLSLEELKDGSGVRTGWIVKDRRLGIVETYDLTGRLLALVDVLGRRTTLTHSTASTPVAVAPTAGLVIGAADSFGRSLSIRYDAQGRVNKVGDPAGGEFAYGYDEASSVVVGSSTPNNNLTSAKSPDGVTRIYHYNEQNNSANTNQPNALTGISIKDTSGVVRRLSTYKYDAQGKTVESAHVLGANLFRFSYSTDVSGVITSTVVTSPLSTASTFAFSQILGLNRVTQRSQTAGSGSGPSSSAIAYDAQANVSSRTDFNNNKICYAYDLSRNLETKRVEGVNE